MTETEARMALTDLDRAIIGAFDKHGMQCAWEVRKSLAEIMVAREQSIRSSAPIAGEPGAMREALDAVVKFVGKQEPDKLPDDLLYGMLGIEKMCRHALAALASAPKDINNE